MGIIFYPASDLFRANTTRAFINQRGISQSISDDTLAGSLHKIVYGTRINDSKLSQLLEHKRGNRLGRIVIPS